jgi:hypothetical protein
MPSSTAATLGSGANRVGVPLLLPGRRGAQSLPRLNRLVRKRVPGVVRRVPLRLAGWLLAGIPTVSSAQDEPAWFPALQAADGRWPAKDVDIADPADVRVSAWMALSLAGEGCSLGRGGLSAQLRSTVHWLLAQQDGQGRIGLRADCDWLLDHAMATYALCEATFDSRSANAAGPVLAAVAALQREVLRMRPAPGVELRLWGELVAKSLRVRAERATKQDPPPKDAERRTLAERKEAGATLLWNLERLPPLPPLDADAPVRERAAQTLRAALAVEFRGRDSRRARTRCGGRVRARRRRSHAAARPRCRPSSPRSPACRRHRCRGTGPAGRPRRAALAAGSASASPDRRRSRRPRRGASV